MSLLAFDLSGAKNFWDESQWNAWEEKAQKARETLLGRTGKGAEFLGWLDLPVEMQKEVARIEEVAGRLRERCHTFITIGIGGSYLGTRAAAEALGTPKAKLEYAGHHLSATELARLMKRLNPRETGLIVISKSGTTTEPAVAFRVLKRWLEDAVGKTEAARRIIAVTDAKRGALRRIADREGYAVFEIPDSVGGRFSVLSAVGLVPLAAAGVDIQGMLQGAQQAREIFLNEPFSKNPALQYAAARNALYQKGKSMEIVAVWQPALHFVAEWWKQLFGESEGKEEKGLYPASVDFTTDLHSLGQYLQEGRRIFLETFLWVEKEIEDLQLPAEQEDDDGLNDLAGRPVSWINTQAMKGTAQAHQEGGVPVLRVILPRLDALVLGGLFYFWEAACGVSGYLLDVNPFNQPGVEAYKRNMFALLGKKGFESLAAELRKKGVF